MHRVSTVKSEVKLVCKGILTVKCRNKPSDFSDGLLGLKLNKRLSVLDFTILCPPSFLIDSDISYTPLGGEVRFGPKGYTNTNTFPSPVTISMHVHGFLTF